MCTIAMDIAGAGKAVTTDKLNGELQDCLCIRSCVSVRYLRTAVESRANNTGVTG